VKSHYVCEGTGAMQARRSLPVHVPAGAADRTLLEYDLAIIGAPGTILHVEPRVR